MKRSSVIFAVVAGIAVVAAGVFAGLYFSNSGSKSEATAKTSSLLPVSPGRPPSERLLLGSIKSLTKAGDQYVLRFDPVILTSGVTANVLQAEQQGESCKPTACPPVPNDNLIFDEGHQLLTYLVPDDAKVTILVRSVNPLEISVSELADLVAGKEVAGLPYVRPYISAVDFWIDVYIDTVRSITQQYQP
jgi:hypothetical protein